MYMHFMDEKTVEGFPLTSYNAGMVQPIQRFKYTDGEIRDILPIFSSYNYPAEINGTPVVGAILLVSEYDMYGYGPNRGFYLDFRYTDRASELGKIEIPQGKVPEFLAFRFRDFAHDPIDTDD